MSEKDLEDRIDELKRIIRRKNDTIEKLQSDLRKSDDNLNTAEFKIRTELDPRIKAEHDSYDRYITSPESHMSEEDALCYHNCTSDRCGAECKLFGDNPECTANLSDKELLEAYVENDNCESIILERGLWYKKLKIDWKQNTQELRNWKDRFKKERRNRLDRLIYNFKNRH